MKALFGIFLLLCLSACSSPPLSVFNEYLSIESLPSYRIGTPDPRLYCPDHGQKLHISWEVPLLRHNEDLHMNLHLRFGNRTHEEYSFQLYERKGIYVFPLINEEYWNRQGIFTYKIELYHEGELVDVWQHILWATPIDLHDED